jgi:hypothetical protein
MRTRVAMLRKAAEIEAQAKTVTDAAIRAELLYIAARYRHMADHHERTARVITPVEVSAPPPDQQ